MLTRTTGLLAFVLFVGCNQEQAPLNVPGPTTTHAESVPTAKAAAPVTAAKGWDSAAYRAAIQDGVEAMLAANPPSATKAGDHRFDEQWPDLSEAAQAKVSTDFRARAQALRVLAANAPADAEPGQAGTDHPAIDAMVLADRLESIAYELDTMRALERDPSRVLGVVGVGVTGLIDHDYAPKHARVDALATRLAAVPALLTTARARLKKPSHAGLENMGIVAKGMSGMLRGAVVTEGVKDIGDDGALKDRLTKNATAAAAAIDAFAAEVTKAFPLAQAKDEPIGAEKWATMARLGEGVVESPAEVRKMGEAEIARLDAELDALIADEAKKSGAKPATRAAYLARMEQDQPKPDKVLDDYRAANKGVEEWMRSHPFVDVPWDRAKLEIVQTPPHMRGVSFASMNVAGPLEPTIADARFEVNVPDASMPPEKQKALLKFNAHGAIEMVSVHEAIPGHYLQFLYVRQTPSKVRKLTGASTFTEGWAHYCELAVREAGYTGGNEARTHAFYLRMALQRATRVVVDVAENDGSMTVEQGAKFLEENALLAPEAAKIEARRAVVWPANMFSYTYGKLAILKLRDEVKARATEKEPFDLVKFHDRLLSVGLVPIKYVGPLAFGTK